VGGPATGCSIVLPLPIADAARLARPDLNPCIARFRIERIAVTLRELRSDRAARFLRADMRDCDVGSSHLEIPGNSDPGIGPRFRAGLRTRTVASGIGSWIGSSIGSCLDRNRCEFSRRPKRFRRKHRLGKVEAEELVGTVLICLRRTTPRQQHSANCGRQNSFQNHVRFAEMLGSTTPHVGSRQRKFKRKLRSNQSCQQHSRSSMSAAPKASWWFRRDVPCGDGLEETLRIDILYITY